MKKSIYLTIILLLIFFIQSCSPGSDNTSPSSWETAKANASVEIALTGEYENAHSLNIATLGWEDGLNVSRNGLYIYATYIPADFLSFVMASGTPDQLPAYARGPEYDMDFDTNPAGESYKWYQSDIRVISNTTADPSGTGTEISTVDADNVNTEHIEDNPHLEKLSATDWVLFFDSEDRPNGEGSHDIWYSLSTDSAATWSTPVNVSSINTAQQNHQPHLYHNGSDWYLYFSQPYNGKLAIYRSIQGTEDNWNSWQTPQLVISAGNTEGIGEPTLTDEGDLFFVAVTQNPQGSATDRYDADPWMAERK